MIYGFLIWSWMTFGMTQQTEKVPMLTPSIVQLAYNLQHENINAAPLELKAEKTIIQEANASNVKHGVASFYHDKFVGRKTATGEVFSNEKFTAASNHFKLGTFVKVTNVNNGRSIYVKINDRMGHPSRVIDLTERAARELKFVNRGVAKVKIETVNKDEGKRKVLAQVEPNMDTVATDNQF